MQKVFYIILINENFHSVKEFRIEINFNSNCKVSWDEIVFTEYFLFYEDYFLHTRWSNIMPIFTASTALNLFSFLIK
jgi:hypothetical protein